MTQRERRLFLIRYLLEESKEFRGMEIPRKDAEQKHLLRALFNVRMPKEVSPEFLEIQDAHLTAENEEAGIMDYKTLAPREPGMFLWQGDIRTLKCDAIVNAANSQMLGCFRPNHNCIDNCIHTFAGIQLRADCLKIMQDQGHEEETGKAKITPAYNLPSKYVIHTVGPIVNGRLTSREEALLASSYESCLNIAEEKGCESIGFCCISTGVFGFPKKRAAEIAVETVGRWKAARPESCLKDVIFNVFGDEDLRIYESILR